MERIALPNIFILFASLSLWTLAVQLASGDSQERIHPDKIAIRAVNVLISRKHEVKNGLVGEKLLESGAPITAAAAGHWF